MLRRRKRKDQFFKEIGLFYKLRRASTSKLADTYEPNEENLLLTIEI